MKHFKSSNGAYLTLVQGENLGDGIPRGQLTLVTEDNIHMFFNPFDKATVTVVKPKGVAIQLRVRMPKNESITLSEVIEWLSSEFKFVVNFGIADAKPNGKTVTFIFPLTNKQAAKLGYRGQDGECVILKRAS